MDTKKDSSVSDVPTFKVARVGNDRKRKGGAFSFLRGGGSRGAWSGATGGSGAGGLGGVVNAIGLNFTKTMLAIMLASGIGAAAIYAGAHSGANAGSTGAKKAIFSNKGDIKMEGDTSNLPSNANTIPNSLGYLSGSMDGLTPEERAKKAADAAAAAEAQRRADEEAAKKAEADALAGKGAADPAALLASAQADGGGKGSAFGKKFGSLSSSLGGGSSLSGGAGLSGGVNRSFGQSGSITKGSSGQLGAMTGGARPTYSKSARAAVGKSNVKGFARRQLANANALSRRGATAGNSETATYDAASAFDNNQGAGNVISGPGVGGGTGPSNGGGSSPNPGGGGGGGPTGPGTPSCGTGEAVNASGACVPIKDPNAKNVTPYQMLYDLAMMLLMLVTILTLIAAIMDKVPQLKIAAKTLRMIVMGIGLVIAALGLAIVAMTGDKMAGGILTAVGVYIAATAFFSKASAFSNTGLRQIAIKLLIGQVIGGFGAAMAHKPAGASQ